MNYSKNILKKLDINIQFFCINFYEKLLLIKQKYVIIYTYKKNIKEKNYEKNKLIEKWNKEKGGNFGIYLPLDEKNYVEIGNEILILKEIKLYFKNINIQESEKF